MTQNTDAAAKPKTKVLVLYTGGTIGMVPTDPANEDSPLRPAPKEDLVRFVRNPLEGVSWDMHALVDSAGEPVGPLDSSSVGPKEWIYMAEAIERDYANYDGFVVLHGTDTMAYTASALSFLLQNLDKPVVVTGSQLPIFRPRTDAVLNFINALYIAGYRATGIPKVTEVVICFGDSVLRGNRTTKTSTSRWQGFESPNYGLLGTIGEYILIDKKNLLPPPPEGTFFAHREITESVATIPIYPGMDAKILEKMLSVDVKGIILRTFGTGNAPDNKDFLDVIAKAVRDGKTIVNTTQCLEGRVEQGLYEASSGLQDAGVISGINLTPEAALTKLMWLLANEAPEEVFSQMQISQRGESDSLFDLRFGEVGSKEAAVETARVSQRPPGKFSPENLSKAILRIVGLGVEGASAGDEIRLGIFINMPGATASTPASLPQFAGYATGTCLNGTAITLRHNVSGAISRVYEAGRPLTVTLVAQPGQKFYAKGIHMTLVNELT